MSSFQAINKNDGFWQPIVTTGLNQSLRFVNHSMRNFSNFSFVLECYVTLKNTMCTPKQKWWPHFGCRRGVKNNVANSCGCKCYNIQSFDDLSNVTQRSTVPHAPYPDVLKKKKHSLKFHLKTFVYVGTLREFQKVNFSVCTFNKHKSEHWNYTKSSYHDAKRYPIKTVSALSNCV